MPVTDSLFFFFRGDGPEGPDTEVADLRYGYLQKLEDSHKKVPQHGRGARTTNGNRESHNLLALKI